LAVQREASDSGVNEPSPQPFDADQQRLSHSSISVNCVLLTVKFGMSPGGFACTAARSRCLNSR